MSEAPKITMPDAADYDDLELLRKHAAELRDDLHRIEDRIRRIEQAQWQQYRAERAAAIRRAAEGAIKP